METMRAVILTGHGGLEKLEYRKDWPKPRPAAGEVLVRVCACGLNNTDVNTRTGWYSPSAGGATTGDAQPDAREADAAWSGTALQFPRIQGGDAAGIVESAEDAELIGRRVLIDPCMRDPDAPDDLEKVAYFGSECDGGFAEYVKVPARQVYPVNCGLSDAELATFAISYSTAENMLTRAKVCAEDTVLISGASGGVGSALIQLAKRRGARVAALSGESKHDALREIGADLLLPRAPQDLPAALAAFGPVSVVADVVGGAYFSALENIIRRGGRYVCSGAIAGAEVRFDLRPFYLRDLTFYGATALAPGVFANLTGYIERGEIRPLLAKTYPLKNLREAQQEFIQKRHIGNIAVVM
ncbi:MAG: alcohol dehydrogenase family protein [Gammaproteobacteria bacterium]